MTLIHQFTLLVILSNIIIQPTDPFQHEILEILKIPLIKPMFLPSNHPKHPWKRLRIVKECCTRKGVFPNIIYPFFSRDQYSLFSRSSTILVIDHDISGNFSPLSNSNINGFSLKYLSNDSKHDHIP